MVENASRRFRLSWESAIREETITVKAAIHASTTPVSSPSGPSSSTPKTPVTTRTTQKTPTFTTATACSRADTGVGATMAPGSHE